MKKLPIAEVIRKLFGGDGSLFSITFGVGVGCTGRQMTDINNTKQWRDC